MNLLLGQLGEVANEYDLFRFEHEVSAAAEDACLARQIEKKIPLLDILQERRRKPKAAAENSVPPPTSMEMANRSPQVVANKHVKF